MDQFSRLAFCRHKVVPASGCPPLIRDTQDPVRKGIAAMMIKKQPSIETALLQSFLNLVGDHSLRFYALSSSFSAALDGLRVRSLTTIRLIIEAAKAGYTASISEI